MICQVSSPGCLTAAQMMEGGGEVAAGPGRGIAIAAKSSSGGALPTAGHGETWLGTIMTTIAAPELLVPAGPVRGRTIPSGHPSEGQASGSTGCRTKRRGTKNSGGTSPAAEPAALAVSAAQAIQPLRWQSRRRLHWPAPIMAAASGIPAAGVETEGGGISEGWQRNLEGQEARRRSIFGQSWQQRK